MLKIALKSMSSHKRRLLGTASAVLIGVAFLSATLVLGDTTRGGFDELFSQANAGTDAVVRSATELGSDQTQQTGLVDTSLVDTVRGVQGVQVAEPRISGIGQIVGADGDPLGGNGPPT